VSWLSLVANVVFCLMLMPFMQHAGIALASSISVFFQLFMLHRHLVKSGIRISRDHLRQFLKMIAASAVMGIALLPCAHMELWNKGFTPLSGSLLILCVVGGVALYFGLLWIMGIRSFPGQEHGQ